MVVLNAVQVHSESLALEGNITMSQLSLLQSCNVRNSFPIYFLVVWMCGSPSGFSVYAYWLQGQPSKVLFPPSPWLRCILLCHVTGVWGQKTIPFPNHWHNKLIDVQAVIGPSMPKAQTS